MIKDFKLNLFTLYFIRRELEVEFNRKYPIYYRLHTQIALTVGIVVYSAFMYLDYVADPVIYKTLWTIRFSIFIPIGLFILVVSKTEFFNRWMQVLLSIAVMSCYVSVILMMYYMQSENQFIYYIGIYIIAIFSYGFIRLKFLYASFTGLLSMIMYSYIIIYIAMPINSMIISIFFLITSHIVGMMICYTIEYYTRKDFFNILKSSESDKRKNEFISIIAHELKTPLTVIKGFSEIIEIEDEENRFTKYVNLINTNVDKLNNLVIDLVESTNIELNNLKVVMEKCDAVEILYSVAKSFELAIQQKGLNFEVSHKKDSIYIEADAKRVEQVLNNLISNSIKFTETGFIKLILAEDNGNVVFYVEDTGCGIPLKEIPFIFNRFYQVESLKNPNRKIVGSGLGLAISKGLVELMNGEISVQSIIDEYTCFTVKLRKYNVKKNNGN